MRAFKNILFFLILIAILAGTSQLMENTAKADDNLIQSRNKNLVNFRNEKESSIDMLVIGDSESFTLISPMVLWRDHGITSYNLGQVQQQTQEMYYMLKEAMHDQSPELVVVETNAWFNTLTGVGGVRESVSQFGNYYLPVFRYHDVWKPLLLGHHYKEDDYKGFVIKDATVSYDGGEYMNKTTEEVEISYMAKIYMAKIIELCNEKGAKILLLSAPSPINYNYRKHNAIQEYADENSLEYLDLNLKTKELNIDWKTDSLDKGDHLNLRGAHKASKYLGDYLAEKYDLPDRRGDTSYQEWESTAKEYETKTKEKLEAMQK